MICHRLLVIFCKPLLVFFIFPTLCTGHHGEIAKYFLIRISAVNSCGINCLFNYNLSLSLINGNSSKMLLPRRQSFFFICYSEGGRVHIMQFRSLSYTQSLPQDHARKLEKIAVSLRKFVISLRSTLVDPRLVTSRGKHSSRTELAFQSM